MSDALIQTGNGGWRNETEKFVKLDNEIAVRSAPITEDGLINKTNPLPIQDIDATGRNSFNSVFGEKVIGIRRADIAAQFHYGFPAGDADLETLNGGTIGIIESMLTVSTGTNVAGSAAISNKKALRYIPGHEAYIFFTTVFTAGQINSLQRVGLFNSENGFFIGYDGTDFCVTRRRDGVDTKTIIDISTVYDDGSFDPTKGNVYKISFGYLGFATINFEVLQPNGTWKLFNQIQYPNSATVTHITSTNLQPRAEVANTGNNTDISIKSGSFTAGVINGGGEDPAARRFTLSLVEQVMSAGENMLVTFRSKSTFNSLTNYIQSILTLMSPSADLSKLSLWEFRKNMTITGTPTWTDVNTLDSIMEYSTDALVISGTGKTELAFTLAKAGDLFERIEDEKIEVFPGDTVTLLITTPLGTTGTTDFSLRWKELF